MRGMRVLMLAMIGALLSLHAGAQSDPGEPGSITVRVVDPSNAPIPNAVVRVRERNASNSGVLRFYSCDEDGSVVIPHLRYGTFDVYVLLPSAQLAGGQRYATASISPARPHPSVSIVVKTSGRGA